MHGIYIVVFIYMDFICVYVYIEMCVYLYPCIASTFVKHTEKKKKIPRWQLHQAWVLRWQSLSIESLNNVCSLLKAYALPNIFSLKQ